MDNLVSVIVPIYYVEKYLSKFIDSIIEHQKMDLEMIMVDDGSPDGCPALYAEGCSLKKRINCFIKIMIILMIR